MKKEGASNYQFIPQFPNIPMTYSNPYMIGYNEVPFPRTINYMMYQNGFNMNYSRNNLYNGPQPQGRSGIISVARNQEEILKERNREKIKKPFNIGMTHIVIAHQIVNQKKSKDHIAVITIFH